MKQTKQDPGVRAFICASRSFNRHRDVVAMFFVCEGQQKSPICSQNFPSGRNSQSGCVNLIRIEFKIVKGRAAEAHGELPYAF